MSGERMNALISPLTCAAACLSSDSENIRISRAGAVLNAADTRVNSMQCRECRQARNVNLSGPERAPCRPCLQGIQCVT